MLLDATAPSLDSDARAGVDAAAAFASAAYFGVVKDVQKRFAA